MENDGMIVEFRKWGNSLAVRIPEGYGRCR